MYKHMFKSTLMIKGYSVILQGASTVGQHTCGAYNSSYFGLYVTSLTEWPMCLFCSISSWKKEEIKYHIINIFFHISVLISTELE